MPVSSWYFLRYMDPHNDKEFCSRSASVITGTRLIFILAVQNMQWVICCIAVCGPKFLFDLGYIGFDEPYKKLVNQGMIQGVQQVCIQGSAEQINLFRTGLKDQSMKQMPLHVDVNMVDGVELDIEGIYENGDDEFADAEFIFRRWKIYLRDESGENEQEQIQHCKPR